MYKANTINNVKNTTVSIVSHGQFNMVIFLLKDLRYFENLNKIILTINIPERVEKTNWINNLPLKIIYNKYKKGFAENHNQAFRFCNTKYFLVLNPDIRLKRNIFMDMITLKESEKINILGPIIKDTNNLKSVNSRKFPDIFFLFYKCFFKKQVEYFYNENDKIILTDWIGGMFMLFSKYDYKTLNGFDEEYFLYFEDVDICKRANDIGFKVAQSKKIVAIHEAQRKSYSNMIHLMYHLKSYFLYLKKHIFKF